MQSGCKSGICGLSVSAFGNSVSMPIAALGLSGHCNGYRATVAVICNSGQRFPIGGPLPPFHIDRFLHLHQFYTFIHIHAFYDRTVTAQYVAIVLNLGIMRERAKSVKVANSFNST